MRHQGQQDRKSEVAYCQSCPSRSSIDLNDVGVAALVEL